jgi:aminoglycoside phosphotransferase (APT) family kinase protein
MADATSTKAAHFNDPAAHRALMAACEAAGLDSDGAELRLGENALFRLAAEPVVVRIARTMAYWPDAVKEVAVARWLAGHKFPASRVIDVSQPVRADGHPVTFWRYIPGRRGNPGDITELGLLLRQLHALPRPADFDLPGEDILGRVRGRIESAPVPAADKDFLLGRLAELEEALPRLRYPLPPAPTHGDAHVQNLMFEDSQPLLIDFERFAWGQPEWDLAMTATEYLTAGWWTEAEYGKFTEAYGYDITSWTEGFNLLRATHEIKMTTWIMQNTHSSPAIAEEYEKRMRTIRGHARETDRWQPF